MNNEVNKTNEVLYAQQEVILMKSEARQRKIDHWLEKIKNSILLEKKSYLSRSIDSFIHRGGGRYYKYGDVGNYKSMYGNYIYHSILAAFGVNTPSNENVIPISQYDSHIYQDFFSSHGVGLLIKSNSGSNINESLLQDASTYVQSLPNSQWINELSEWHNEGPDSIKVTGHKEKLSEQIIIELSLLISKLSTNNLEPIFEEINQKIDSGLSSFSIDTKFEGVSVVINIEKDEVFPTLEVDKNLVAENGNKPFFSDSNTFVAIVMGFSSANLTLSERLQSSIFESEENHSYSDRYGNGYADLSRKIAEQVGKSKKDIVSNIFQNETVETAERKINKLPNLSIRSPAGLLFNMLKNLFSNKEESDKEEKYQLSNERSIKDGSCKDAETYYASAKTYERGSNRTVIYENEDFIIKSGYGAETAMLKEQRTFFGITFPSGYLFHLKNNELRPLRPTMACFSEELAKDAFGWQYNETIKASSVDRITTRIKNLLDPIVHY
jgi:hypothetical protein